MYSVVNIALSYCRKRFENARFLHVQVKHKYQGSWLTLNGSRDGNRNAIRKIAEDIKFDDPTILNTWFDNENRNVMTRLQKKVQFYTLFGTDSS